MENLWFLKAPHSYQLNSWWLRLNVPQAQRDKPATRSEVISPAFNYFPVCVRKMTTFVKQTAHSFQTRLNMGRQSMELLWLTIIGLEKS